MAKKKYTRTRYLCAERAFELQKFVARRVGEIGKVANYELDIHHPLHARFQQIETLLTELCIDLGQYCGDVERADAIKEELV